jgi:MFS family permease
MKRYWEILRIPSARNLMISAFPGRLAYGMISLGIYFKVQQSTHSIAAAGLAVGLNGAAGAFTAGPRGAVIDRWGMKWPLRFLVPSYATLILIFNAGSSRTYLIALAFILGFTAPPINLSVRPLWKITVPKQLLRSALAIDTAIMNTVGVFGPVIVTFFALSTHPQWALYLCAGFMYLGGFALMSLPVTRKFVPEKKEKDSSALWRVPAVQILAIEGAFIGLGMGAWDIGVPAFATLKRQPHLAGTILAIMAGAIVLGGFLAGLISRKTSSLSALRKIYFGWFIFSIPLALTNPGWSIYLVTASVGLLGGGLQVFYWEVIEAVRPKGSQSGTLGWLWTIEGTMSAIGASLGGLISQHFTPRYCFLIMTASIGFGLTIINLGRKKLSAADRAPSEEEDTEALGDVISRTD